MQRSDDGYVPARCFLERCMAPRPEFNDGTDVNPVTVTIDDGRSCDHGLGPCISNDKYCRRRILGLARLRPDFWHANDFDVRLTASQKGRHQSCKR